MKKHFVVLLIKNKKLFLVMASWVVSQCSMFVSSQCSVLITLQAPGVTGRPTELSSLCQ